MVMEKLLYSKKFMLLMLIILYSGLAYIVGYFNRESLIYGSIIVIASLLYMLYYAINHRSIKEVIALTVFVSLSIILGLITGLLIGGYRNIGATLYALTLSVSTLLILYVAYNMYRI